MAIEEAAVEVAQNLEEAALVARQVNTQVVRYFLGGVGLGGVLGFFTGHRFMKESIKAEAFKKSEEEVAIIRETYRARTAGEAPREDIPKRGPYVPREKPSVDEIIAQRGYSVKAENVHVDPETGATTMEYGPDVVDRPTRPPVPVQEPLRPTAPRVAASTWNYAVEQSRRSVDRPYIIHRAEFMASDTGYSQVEYTFWMDGVLTDEDNDQIHQIDLAVGQNNLRFGHGSEDPNTVFVRNDKLELEIEITRSPRRYDEHVLGIDQDESA